MIDLPPNEKRRALERQLVQGVIFRFRAQRDQLADPNVESRHKYALVVSLGIERDEILYAFATSKTERYQHAKFDQEVIRIPSSRYGFLTKESVISFREVYAVSIERLSSLHTPSELEVVGQLGNSDLKEALERIRNSKVLSARIIKRCCGE